MFPPGLCLYDTPSPASGWAAPFSFRERIMKCGILFVAIVLLLPLQARAAVTFADWISADPTHAVANLGTASVVFSGDLVGDSSRLHGTTPSFADFVLNGGNTTFNSALFTPPLPSSDLGHFEARAASPQ